MEYLSAKQVTFSFTYILECDCTPGIFILFSRHFWEAIYSEDYSDILLLNGENPLKPMAVRSVAELKLAEPHVLSVAFH